MRAVVRAEVERPHGRGVVGRGRGVSVVAGVVSVVVGGAVGRRQRGGRRRRRDRSRRRQSARCGRGRRRGRGRLARRRRWVVVALGRRRLGRRRLAEVVGSVVVVGRRGRPDGRDARQARQGSVPVGPSVRTGPRRHRSRGARARSRHRAAPPEWDGPSARLRPAAGPGPAITCVAAASLGVAGRERATVGSPVIVRAQIVEERRAVGGPCCRVLRERRGRETLEARGRVGRELGDGRRRVVAVHAHELHRVRRDEGQPPREHPEEDHAERVDVARGRRGRPPACSGEM